MFGFFMNNLGVLFLLGKEKEKEDGRLNLKIVY